MSIGEAIREWRREYGVSQREVAEKLHVDRSLVARAENGAKLSEAHDPSIAGLHWKLALEVIDQRTGGWISNILHECPNLDLHPAALKDLMMRELSEMEEALRSLIMARHIDREKSREQAEKTWMEIQDVLEKGAVMKGVLEEYFGLDRESLIRRHRQEVKEGKR